MKLKTLLCLLATFIIMPSFLSAQTKNLTLITEFDTRVVAAKLSDPWELCYGPDKHLWVTEAKGYRVLRINTETGARQVLLDLSKNKNFGRYDLTPDEQDGAKPWPQGGLMGMALHPMLLEGKPYVYLAYIHHFKGAADAADGRQGKDGYQFLMKIVRYTYYPAQQKLLQPLTICDTIPASNDHNGGRLAIAEVEGKPFLLMSVGDMGAGQFLNGGRTNKAQDPRSYEGKILRYALEPGQQIDDKERTVSAGAKGKTEGKVTKLKHEVGKGAYGEAAWIPADNPFNSRRRNAVWSTGHRNAQGLAFAKLNGREFLYSTEHGPYGDDELNIIEKGKNYGHPLIIGYADGNYDGLAASVSNDKSLPGRWNTSYPLIVNEKDNAMALGNDYRDPIKSFDAAPGDTLLALFHKIQQGEKADWPSYAPSSVAVYLQDAIPGWKNSLLISTLKGSRLLRLQLDESGKIANDQIFEYAKGDVRYRDVAVSADGLKIYLAVDSASVSSGPSKEDPKKISYRGSIIELSYKVDNRQPAKQPD